MAIKIWGAGSSGGMDGDFNNPLNWDNDEAPFYLDSILVNSTALYNMTNGPFYDLTFADITITSDATASILTGSFGSGQNTGFFIITGELRNDSLNSASIRAKFYGCTGIFGAWSDSAIKPVKLGIPPGDLPYSVFNLNNFVFDNVNYILPPPSGHPDHVGFGSMMKGEHLQAPEFFQSFTLFENSNSSGIPIYSGNSGEFSSVPTLNIAAETINVTGNGTFGNSADNYFYAVGFFDLTFQCAVMNVNTTASFLNIPSFGLSLVCKYQFYSSLSNPSLPLVVNIDLNNTSSFNIYDYGGFNAVFGLTVYANATFNFYGDTQFGITGSEDNFYYSVTPPLFSFLGSANFNFYENSSMVGYIKNKVAQRLDSREFNYNFPFNLINFYDRSYFNGVIYNGEGLNFYDKSFCFGSFETNINIGSNTWHIFYSRISDLSQFKQSNKSSF